MDHKKISATPSTNCGAAAAQGLAELAYMTEHRGKHVDYVLIGFLFRKTNRNYGQVLTTVKYRLNVTEQAVHACVHPPYHDPPGVSAYCRQSFPSAAERCID